MADNTLDPPAWGEGKLEAGTPGAGDTLATTFEDFGWIVDDSIGAAAEDGTPLELRSWGGILRFMQDTEKTVTITGTLMGIPDATIAKFWKVDSTTDPNMTWVNSMVVSDKFSIRMSTPSVVGSKRLNVPFANVSLGVAYAQAEGWTAPFTITLLKGATGRMFGWDKVPAPVPEA